MKKWYYVSDGKASDPIEFEEVAQMVGDGRLGLEDFLYREGDDRWKAANEYTELNSYWDGKEQIQPQESTPSEHEATPAEPAQEASVPEDPHVVEAEPSHDGAEPHEDPQIQSEPILETQPEQAAQHSHEQPAHDHQEVASDHQEDVVQGQWVLLKLNQDGQNYDQIGPFSNDEIEARLKSGETTYEDFIWKSGMSEWQPIKDVSVFNMQYPIQTQEVEPEEDAEILAGVAVQSDPQLAAAVEEEEQVQKFEEQQIEENPAQLDNQMEALKIEERAMEVDFPSEEPQQSAKPDFKPSRLHGLMQKMPFKNVYPMVQSKQGLMAIVATFLIVSIGITVWQIFDSPTPSKKKAIAKKKRSRRPMRKPLPMPNRPAKIEEKTAAAPQAPMPGDEQAAGEQQPPMPENQQVAEAPANSDSQTAPPTVEPEKTPEPPKEPVVNNEPSFEPATTIDIVAMKLQTSKPKLIFKTDMAKGDTLEVEVYAPSGKILGQASYLRDYKVVRQGIADPQLSLEKLKTGEYIISAKTGDVSKSIKVFVGKKSRGYRGKLRNYKKQISFRQQEEKKRLIILAKRVVREIERQRRGKNPGFKKTLVKLQKNKMGELFALKNGVPAYPKAWIQFDKKIETLIDQLEGRQLASNDWSRLAKEWDKFSYYIGSIASP